MDPFTIRPPRFYLTVAQLRDALKMADPDGNADPETPMVLSHLPARTADDGEWMKEGLYIWLADYPEEGVIGPLGDPE